MLSAEYDRLVWRGFENLNGVVRSSLVTSSLLVHTGRAIFITTLLN